MQGARLDTRCHRRHPGQVAAPTALADEAGAPPQPGVCLRRNQQTTANPIRNTPIGQPRPTTAPDAARTGWPRTKMKPVAPVVPLPDPHGSRATRPDHLGPRAYALTRRFDAARLVCPASNDLSHRPASRRAGTGSVALRQFLPRLRAFVGSRQIGAWVFRPAPCQCQTEGNAP